MSIFSKVPAGFAAMTMLTLGACADRQEPGPSASTIIWNTDRATSTEPSPTATPSNRGGANQSLPSTTGPSVTQPSADGCREYSQTVTIDGRPQQVYGRACPQPDGSWRLNPPAAAPASRSDAPERYVVPAYPAYGPYGTSMFFGSTFVFSGRQHRHYR